MQQLAISTADRSNRPSRASTASEVLHHHSVGMACCRSVRHRRRPVPRSTGGPATRRRRLVRCPRGRSHCRGVTLKAPPTPLRCADRRSTRRHRRRHSEGDRRRFGDHVVGVIAGSRCARQPFAPAAVTGALVIQCLLRASALGFLGLPTLLGVIALVPVIVSGYSRARTPGAPHRRRLGLRRHRRRHPCSPPGPPSPCSRTAPRSSKVPTTPPLGSTACATAARMPPVPPSRGTDDFDTASSTMEGWIASGARYLPVVGQHVEALRRGRGPGAELGRDAAITASSADYRDLTADAGQVDLTKIEALQDPVRESAATIAAARASVAHVPSPWLLAPVAQRARPVQREAGRARGPGVPGRARPGASHPNCSEATAPAGTSSPSAPRLRRGTEAGSSAPSASSTSPTGSSTSPSPIALTVSIPRHPPCTRSPAA